MRTRFFCLVLASTLGCAPQPGTAPTAGVPSGSAAAAAGSATRTPTKFDDALERARALRRQAEAIAFVAPVGESSTDARIEALGRWLQSRKDATNRAEASFVAAREYAAPPEQVLLERERGELFFGLFQSAVNASLSIFPDLQHASSDKLAMLRGQVSKTFLPFAGLARERFVACLMLSSQLGLPKADSDRCEAPVRTIDALSAPKEKRDAALDEWRVVRVEEAPRARRPVTRGSGCAFRGSAWSNSWIKLYPSAIATDFDLMLEDFDVAQLELPKARDQRAKLSIDYPFKASGYIDFDSSVIETDARIDLLPKHVWLNPRSIVRAYAANGSQVQIEREANEKSEPAVALSVPCSQLTLTREGRPPAEAKGETAQLSGVVPLLGGPGGKRIAQLDVTFAVNVRVLAREGGWVHVTTTDAGMVFAAPYEFDAWIAEQFAPAGKRGSFLQSLGPPSKPATHVTSAPLALRLSPDPKAPVVAELATGVQLLAGPEQGTMRRIRFNQAHGGNEGEDFWVIQSELTRNTVTAKAKPGP